MSEEKNIYDLELHEEVQIKTSNGNSFKVTRVPGGWLYQDLKDKNIVFVPCEEEERKPEEGKSKTVISKPKMPDGLSFGG